MAQGQESGTDPGPAEASEGRVRLVVLLGEAVREAAALAHRPLGFRMFHPRRLEPEIGSDQT